MTHLHTESHILDGSHLGDVSLERIRAMAVPRRLKQRG
jgi:hypothetical protein